MGKMFPFSALCAAPGTVRSPTKRRLCCFWSLCWSAERGARAVRKGGPVLPSCPGRLARGETRGGQAQGSGCPLPVTRPATRAKR